MILLRDFALFVLPVLIATGGWLYAASGRRVQRTVTSCARTEARKCS